MNSNDATWEKYVSSMRIRQHYILYSLRKICKFDVSMKDNTYMYSTSIKCLLNCFKETMFSAYMNTCIVLRHPVINEYHKLHTFKGRHMKPQVLRFYEVMIQPRLRYNLSMPRTLAMNIAQYTIIYTRIILLEPKN